MPLIVGTQLCLVDLCQDCSSYSPGDKNERRLCHVKGGLLTIPCLVVSYCKILSFSSVQNSCRIGLWLYDQMDKALELLAHELKKIAYNIFFELMVLLAIHGGFWSFSFHCLLSALLCGSNMCTQVSSPVSKLEITRLLQPLYVFKSSRAHLRRCVFWSSVSKWGTHLAQTFLRSKHFFRIVCTLPSDMLVQLAISLTQSHILFDHNLYSSDVSLGNRDFRPTRMGIIYNRKFPSFKSFNPPKNCAHRNGLRSIYTTQFIKYLLWIYIKPNAAFNIATNFSLLVHVPV